MAKFLTTDQISSEITNIIKNAGSQITLITPYLKLSDILLERLKDAGRQSKKINLVYGKDELKPDEKSKLQQLANLSLYFSKDLHAKCYYNEECMVIASMNLHEYSQGNNWEMGLLIYKEEDNKLFSEALKEVEIIIRSADKIKSGSPSVFGRVVKETKSILDSAVKDDSRKSKPTSKTRTTSRTKKEGYCIRCKTSIPYNLDSPYCRDCWKKWKEGGGNPDYRERDGKCHACGKPAPTTMLKPQCSSCFRKFYS